MHTEEQNSVSLSKEEEDIIFRVSQQPQRPAAGASKQGACTPFATFGPCTAIALLLFTTLVLSLTILAKPFHSKPSPKPSHGEHKSSVQSSATPGLCVSDDCSAVSWLFTHSQNTNHNPCRNFYKYVCSEVSPKQYVHTYSTLQQVTINITRAILKKSKSIHYHNSNQTAMEKALAFLHICNQRRKHHKYSQNYLKSILKNLSLNNDQANFDPLKVMAELWLHHNLPFLYAVQLDSSYIWKGEPLLSLQLDKEASRWYQRKQHFILGSGSYQRYVSRVLEDVGMTGHRDANRLYHKIRHVEEHVSKRLGEIQLNRDKQWLIVELKLLGAMLGNENVSASSWETVVTKSIAKSKTHMINIGVRKNDALFLQTLFNELTGTMLQALMQWEVIRQLSRAAGNVRNEATSDKWYCFRKALILFGHALMASIFSDPKSQARLTDSERIASSIKTKIIVAMNTSGWLKNMSRQRSLQKLQNIKWSFAYPTELRTDVAINKFYKSYPDIHEPYLSAFLCTSRAHIKSTLKLATTQGAIPMITQAADFASGATYKYETNTLVVSAPMLFAPSLSQGAPAEVNFGGLGRVISLGLMRSFDTIGRNIDERGRHVPLWTKKVTLDFQKRSGCFTSQGPKLPTSRTPIQAVPEYVINALGILPLFRAYKTAAASTRQKRITGLESIAGDKLFFFTWCYALCNVRGGVGGKARRADAMRQCNFPLRNTGQFATAFACPLGSRMNPKKKCTYW